MRSPILILSLSALLLASCSTIRDSRLNPGNWFEASREARAERAAAQSDNPLIPLRSGGLLRSAREASQAYRGAPLEAVTALVAEPAPGGLLVRAEGQTGFADVYDVRLTPENDGEPVEGVLSFRLEGIVPDRPRPARTAAQRTVIAAVKIGDQTLAGVREIRVSGATNSRSVRQR